MDYYLIENHLHFAIVEEYVLAKIKRLNKGLDIYSLYTIKKLNDEDNWDNIINTKHETTNKRYTSIEDEEEIRDYGFVEEQKKEIEEIKMDIRVSFNRTSRSGIESALIEKPKQVTPDRRCTL